MAVIIQDRVIDDNLKVQIKNRTLYIPTNLNFQYISNSSKVISFYPPLSLIYISRAINFQFFHGKLFFS